MTQKFYSLALFFVILFIWVSPAMASDHTVNTPTASITVSAEKNYPVTEIPKIGIKGSSTVGQKLNSIVYLLTGKSRKNTLKITYPTGKEDTQILKGDTNIAMDPNALIPGNYHLEIDDKPVTDFSWGVLVINTDKDVYKVSDTAYIQMAALNSGGHTICDAPLSLDITPPDGETLNFTVGKGNSAIQASPTCGKDNVTDNPDYFLKIKLPLEGKYTLSLTNISTGNTIYSTFSAVASTPFQVERTGATRINPFKSDYTMTLKVTANQDFKGTVKETVPKDFKIINSQTSWEVALKAGEEKSFSYTYSAPKISPEIFLLGPLTIGDYQEPRSWSLASDAAFTMQTGYYIGDGADNRAITGVGFQPELILIKDDTGNGNDGVIWKSTAMTGEVSALLGDLEVDLSTDAIQSLDSDGFTLGTYADVNAANVRFTWVAFRGSDCTSSGTFCVGSYTGDDAATHAINTVGFQPDMVIVKRSGTSAGVFRTSSMGTNVAQIIDSANESTDGTRFKTLDSSGFTVGNGGQVNASTFTYWFFAFKTTANAFAVGTFTGTGSSQSITVGFRPQYVWIKNSNATTPVVPGFNLTESNSDYTGRVNDLPNITDWIKSLDSNGFTVGGAAGANESTKTIYWFAFGGASNPTPSGTYRMKVGTYTGNGTSQSFTGVGFAPDLVIIKDESAANFAVFRTKLMKGNSTAYFATAAVDFTGGITSLDSDGFSVGSDVTVNTNTTTYHYQAFGNAWNPEKNTGASDFAIGAYTGNSGDDRNILRVPFQPDLVAIKNDTNSNGIFRTSAQSGDLAFQFANGAEGSNNIQALNSDGFQVGTAGPVNSGGGLHRWFGFKASSTMKVGNYTGTGSAQNITSLGFSPNMLWVKNATAGVDGVFRPSTISGDSTLYFPATAAAAGRITGFLSNGFSIGGNFGQTNTNTIVYRYAAWVIPGGNTQLKGVNMKGLILR